MGLSFGRISKFGVFCLLFTLKGEAQFQSSQGLQPLQKHPSYQAQPARLSVCLSTCVSLSQPAKRIVALNWSVAEMLLTLGIEPVGVTQTDGYRKWQTNHPRLPANIDDVGRRHEPDLKTIARLKPDLIIGYDYRHQRIYSALSNIAPTLLYQQFPKPGQSQFLYLNAIPSIFTGIAKTVGLENKATQTLLEMEQTLYALKHQLKAAELSHVQLIYGKFVGMGYGLRVFGKNSLAGAVADRLGLQYQWQKVLPGKDFIHLQLEQMGELSHLHLMLAQDQTDNSRFTESPVWSALPFIQENRASNTPPLWSFGGPKSVLKMAQAFADSLILWRRHNPRLQSQRKQAQTKQLEVAPFPKEARRTQQVAQGEAQARRPNE